MSECNFCGATEGDRIQGPGVVICFECVGTCVQVMATASVSMRKRAEYLERNNFKRHCHEGADEMELGHMSEDMKDGRLRG